MVSVLFCPFTACAVLYLCAEMDVLSEGDRSGIPDCLEVFCKGTGRLPICGNLSVLSFGDAFCIDRDGKHGQ